MLMFLCVYGWCIKYYCVICEFCDCDICVFVCDLNVMYMSVYLIYMLMCFVCLFDILM